MAPATKNYLDFAVQISKEAGLLSLDYFQEGLKPEWKGDGSPVTIADRSVEELLRSRIEEAFPTHEILGEELGQTFNEGSQPRWIIDPIDGTRAFVRGIPLYAVLIGLEIQGEIVAGVAHFPALSETIAAGRGLGCWWNDKPARLSEVDRLEDALVIHTNTKKDRSSGKYRDLLRLQDTAQYSTGWGDAYGYLLVATGRAEVMLDIATHPWDCAPFPVMFSELMGYFGDWKGNETIYAGEAMATSQSLLPLVLAHLRG
jgi:myo-inositol-1(or 4)-monophosphatase